LQVGDVGARDQKHEADRAEQHKQREAQAPHKVFVRRHEAHALAVVLLRVLLFKARGDRAQVRLGLRDGHAVFESPDDLDVVRAALLLHAPARVERHEVFRLRVDERETESRGQDADDRHGDAVERDGLADD
jgi:hypothetical protein